MASGYPPGVGGFGAPMGQPGFPPPPGQRQSGPGAPMPPFGGPGAAPRPGFPPAAFPPPGPGGPPGAPGMPPARPPPGQPMPPGGMPPGMPPPGMPGGPPPGMPPPGAPMGMPPTGFGAPRPPGFATGPPGMPPPPGPGGMPPPPGPPGMMPPPGAGMQHPPGAPGMGPPPGVPGMPPGQQFAVRPGMPPPPPTGPMAPQGMYGAPPQQQGMAPQGMQQQGYDPYGSQRVADMFESLTLGGAGPGHPEGIDLMALPRPAGPDLAKALAHQIVYDAGNCSPDNMRLTVGAIPNSTALKARWGLPLGAIVHPMADEAKGREVPVVNLGNAGIIRCRRCRTYMNPFVQWADGGRRFKCNVCGQLNEIPVEYFCNLDHTGRRRDAEERPELSSGTVEYVAPAEYMVRPPMPPVYFFVIDVSYPAISSGMVAAACQSIKKCLDELPGEERTLVGFLTFDSAMHFYNLKSSLTQPQMLVVTELDEPFVPMPDDLLVNLKDSRAVIDALLDTLPNNFANNNLVDSCMGPALQAAFLVMNHIGGKMLLFQHAVPSVGMGKIKNRENITFYNTEREPSLRNPEDGFYKRFAAECSRVQISVDIFAFSLAYMDLASLSAIPRYTCGELYYYPGYSPQRDRTKFEAEIRHNLMRPTAWEAVMRIRCSKGLRISSFHGHFFNRSTDLLALPTCDPDKAFAVQIAHEENMVQSSVAYVQCALLYTNSTGERRIRVHTLSVPVVSELGDLYRAADGGALACLLAKLSIEKSLTSRLDETRTMVQAKVLSALKEFRLLHANAARAPNKLIFPDTLRYLPVYTLGIMKTAALRGGAKDVPPDERMAVGHDIMSAPFDRLMRIMYPSMYPVHDPSGHWGTEVDDGVIELPQTMPVSAAFLSETSAFIIDTSRVLVLWLGRMVAKEWCTEVFGGDPSNMDPNTLSVEPSRGNPLSERINAVVRMLRGKRPVYQQLFVVRQGTPMEMHLVPYFVEDRTHGMPSYSEYMLNLHKSVMSK